MKELYKLYDLPVCIGVCPRNFACLRRATEMATWIRVVMREQVPLGTAWKTNLGKRRSRPCASASRADVTQSRTTSALNPARPSALTISATCSRPARLQDELHFRGQHGRWVKARWWWTSSMLAFGSARHAVTFASAPGRSRSSTLQPREAPRAHHAALDDVRQHERIDVAAATSTMPTRLAAEALGMAEQRRERRRRRRPRPPSSRSRAASRSPARCRPRRPAARRRRAPARSAA